MIVQRLAKIWAGICVRIESKQFEPAKNERTAIQRQTAKESNAKPIIPKSEKSSIEFGSSRILHIERSPMLFRFLFQSHTISSECEKLRIVVDGNVFNINTHIYLVYIGS